MRVLLPLDECFIVILYLPSILSMPIHLSCRLSVYLSVRQLVAALDLLIALLGRRLLLL